MLFCTDTYELQIHEATLVLWPWNQKNSPWNILWGWRSWMIWWSFVFCSDTHILFPHQQQVSCWLFLFPTTFSLFFTSHFLTVISWLIVTNFVLHSNHNDATLLWPFELKAELFCLTGRKPHKLLVVLIIVCLACEVNRRRNCEPYRDLPETALPLQWGPFR